MVAGSSASASHGNLLEVQIFRPHPRPTETPGMEQRNLCVNKPFRLFRGPKFVNPCSKLRGIYFHLPAVLLKCGG